MTKEPREVNTIKSVYKVFYLLEILAKHRKLSVSQLSTLTGYTKSTTQRIVNTLKDLKYIDQDTETLEYYPSIKLYELGSSVVDHLPIKNIARPHLLQLYNKINETINLGVLNGNNVVYLDKLVSTSPLRVELELGVQFPVYCSALGKAIAAFDNKTYSFNGNYIQHTEKTISSDDELYKELENIRQLGYAIDDEEYVDGLICIGVPILNKNNIAIASISISKPAIRYNEANTGYYVDLLKDCANKISDELY